MRLTDACNPSFEFVETSLSKLAILFWTMNIVLDTAGHLAFKSAAITDHDIELKRWKIMLSSPMLWCGVACFILQFGVWFALLSLVPLSLAVLIASINIVAVMLAGYFFLSEPLSRRHVTGICLIAVGVAIAGQHL